MTHRGLPLVLCSLIAGTAVAQESPTADQMTALGRASASWRPKTAWLLRDAYDSILAGATSETLAKLREHEHSGVALQAAWTTALGNEEVVVGGRVVTRWASVEGFLEVVRSRLPVDVPPWWRDIVSKGILSRGGRNPKYSSFLQVGVQLYERPLGREHPRTLKGMQVESGVDGVQVTIGESEFFLSKDLWGKFLPPIGLDGGFFSHGVHSDDAYIVQTSGVFNPSLLIKVDMTTGHTPWTTMICGGVGYTVFGWDYHFVEPRVGCDDRVYVFGAATHAVYIEAFSTETGEPAFRFSSTY